MFHLSERDHLRDRAGNIIRCFYDDEDETDCYSSACEDDQSWGMSDDDEHSEAAFEPMSERAPFDLGKLSDLDHLENRSSPGRDSTVTYPNLNGLMNSPDDDFRGFRVEEIRDNLALHSFQEFIKTNCFCHVVKEEKSDDDGREGVRSLPVENKEIKEEVADDCEEGSSVTQDPPRKTKQEARSALLSTVHGDDVHFDVNKGRATQEAPNPTKPLEYHNEVESEHCSVNLTTIPADVLIDCSLQKQLDLKQKAIEASRRGVWSCCLCTFRTNSKHEFNKHQWIHKQDKFSYKCSICGTKFATPDNLMNHVKKHHETADNVKIGQKKVARDRQSEITFGLRARIDELHKKSKKARNQDLIPKKRVI